MNEEIIYCACGCGRTLMKFDNRGRKRKYIWGHNKPWLNKTRFQETKEKLRLANLGKHYSEKTKMKMSAKRRGKDNPFYRHHHTKEVKQKISEAGKGREGYWLGKKRNITPEWRQKMIKGLRKKARDPEYRKKLSLIHRGEKGSNWQGGKTKESERIRRSIEAHLWREAVFARDNWTCQKCKKRGGKLCSHHIQNFAKYPELRFAIDNGIILCKKCHQEFHKRYKVENNSKEQLEEFYAINNFGRSSP